MIKTAMIVRSTFYAVRGGDTVQVLETARHLRKLGLQTDIRLTDETIDYSAYSLLHFFNITRPADIIYHVNRSDKPFVISTILIDYSLYDKYLRKGLVGLFFRWLQPDAIEYVKTIARWLLGRDRLMSASYLWKGQKKSIRQLLSKAAMLLPNSENEYRRLQKSYGCNNRYRVVPNGIDPELFCGEGTTEKEEDLVICAARIEGVKNQLNLIRALNGSRFRLLLIGSATPNQPSYYNHCKKTAAANIQFAGKLLQDELVQYYRKAKVHILPSWFETTGLSTLEAAAMGCNIVITDHGDAKEYVGSHAFYCDPGNSDSILAAVEKAATAPTNQIIRKKILEHYTWEKAALNTLSAYKEILQHT